MKLLIGQIICYILLLCTFTYAELTTLNISCDPETKSPRCSITQPLTIDGYVTFKFDNSDDWNDATDFVIQNKNQTQNVTKFPSGIFQYFLKLKDVIVSSTGLEVLDRNDFNDANTLEFLDVSQNKINKIPSNLFVGAPNLRRVTMFESNVAEIEPYAFNGTNNLISVELGCNLLTKIERNTFAGANNLTYIRLNSNRIESIDGGAFNLPELVILDLEKNRLQKLPDALLNNVPKLSILDLKDNQLTRIGALLDRLENLDTLWLDNNAIDDIDFYAIAQKPKMNTLYLRNVGLKLDGKGEYPTAAVYPVQWLDISSNGLTQNDILQRLRSFTNLRSLNISANSFTSISQIEQVPQLFPKLYNLEIGTDSTKNRLLISKLRKSFPQNIFVN